MTLLPNPFQFACVQPSQADSAGASSPPAFQVDAPASFSSPLEPVMAGETAAAPALADSRDAAAGQFASSMTMEDIKARPAVVEPITAGATDRFILDVEAFMNDIEPLPAFLSAPSQNYLRATDLIPVLETLAGR